MAELNFENIGDKFLEVINTKEWNDIRDQGQVYLLDQEHFSTPFGNFPIAKLFLLNVANISFDCVSEA